MCVSFIPCVHLAEYDDGELIGFGNGDLKLAVRLGHDIVVNPLRGRAPFFVKETDPVNVLVVLEEILVGPESEECQKLSEGQKKRGNECGAAYIQKSPSRPNLC